MKARIEPDRLGEGFYIIIDGALGTAWAVTEDELIPIRDAINKYLEENENIH